MTDQKRLEPEGGRLSHLDDEYRDEYRESQRSIGANIDNQLLSLAIGSSLPLPESMVSPACPPSEPESRRRSIELAHDASVIPPPLPSSFESFTPKSDKVPRTIGNLCFAGERLKASGKSISSNIVRCHTMSPTLYKMMLSKSHALYSRRSDVNKKDAGAPVGGAILDMSPKPPAFNKQLQENKQRHCHLWFPHGFWWTLAIILLSITALVLSIFAMKSVEFVHLRYPLPVSSDFMDVDSVGLLKLQLCANSTQSSAIDANRGPCQLMVLTSAQDHDRLWIYARTAACLAVAFGFFLTSVISSSISWATINFKPIAISYFVVYVLQSLTFFLFASNLCQTHVCSFGSGAGYSLLASIGWMFLFCACIRMDVVSYRKLRRRGAPKPLPNYNSCANSASTASQDGRCQDAEMPV